jgi:hypothetical protein
VNFIRKRRNLSHDLWPLVAASVSEAGAKLLIRGTALSQQSCQLTACEKMVDLVEDEHLKADSPEYMQDLDLLLGRGSASFVRSGDRFENRATQLPFVRRGRSLNQQNRDPGVIAAGLSSALWRR